MKNVTIILAVLAMLAVTVNAATWNGSADTDYHNSANWNSGTMPNWASESATTYDSDKGIITVSADAYFLSMGFDSEFELQGGTYQVGNYKESNIGWKADKAGDPSLFTQTGGTFDLRYRMSIGNPETNDAALGHGKYVISGGTFTQSAGRQLYLGNTYSSVGVGKGIFNVVGNGPTAITVGILDIVTDISEIVMDFGGGSDPIQQIDVLGAATLNGTLTINGTADVGTYTIMTYGSKSGAYDSIVTPGADWTVTVGATSTTVTVVPEPATMCLLAVGGIGVLIRRKRA